MTENKNVGIIILAAGASTRLGTPKQLLRFQNKTLLRRAVENAVQTKCLPVVTVLGANFELIKAEIENLETEIVVNDRWQIGMSSSIKSGLEKTLELSPEIPGVIIALGDQPFVEKKNYDDLIDKFYATGKPIIASEYNGISGVPALFSSAMFPALMNLVGDKGARDVIKNHPEKIEKIKLSEAAIDIDTAADYEKLIDDFR